MPGDGHRQPRGRRNRDGDSDGVFEAAIPYNRPEDVVAVVRCGTQVAATDPGSWMFQQSTKGLTGYIYTDKPIYRPGHTVNMKSVLRWRVADRLAPFDRKQVEVTVSDPNDKVVLRQQVAVDEFGSALASLARPRRCARPLRHPRRSEGDKRRGAPKCRSRAGVRGLAKPSARFVVGQQRRRRRHRQCYFDNRNGVVK
jgi:hypothetical protein